MSVIDLTRLDGGQPSPEQEPGPHLIVNYLANFALRENVDSPPQEVPQEELIVDHARELGSFLTRGKFKGPYLYGDTYLPTTL